MLSIISKLFSKKTDLDEPADLIDQFTIGMTYDEIAKIKGMKKNSGSKLVNRLYRDDVPFNGLRFRQSFAFDSNDRLSGVILTSLFTREIFYEIIEELNKKQVIFHIEIPSHFYELNEMYEEFPNKPRKEFIKHGIELGVSNKSIKILYIDLDTAQYMKKQKVNCQKSTNIIRAMRKAHRLIEVTFDRSNMILVKFSDKNA